MSSANVLIHSRPYKTEVARIHGRFQALQDWIIDFVRWLGDTEAVVLVVKF